MYDKILLPLDGSTISNQAIPHAITLAKQSGGEVILFQVVDSEAQIISQTTPATIEPVPSGRVTAEVAGQAVQGQRESAQAHLDATKAQFDAAGLGDRVSTVLGEGDAGEAITAFVEDAQCDVVVMATRGRSGFKRAILGSVADYVVRNTPTSAVMLVRAEEPDEE